MSVPDDRTSVASGGKVAKGLPIRQAEPLKYIVVLLALAVLVAGVFVALAAREQVGDDTPRTAAERALMDAKQAIEADPRDIDARLKLARVSIGMGMFEAAKSTLEAAAEIEPDNPKITHLLGLTALESGDADTALVHLETAVQVPGAFAQDYAVIWSDIARARLAKQDTPGAIEAYEEALRHMPQAADIVLSLAQLYESTGRTEDAVRAYEGVTKFMPENGEALEALNRLTPANQ
jgi:tetratricopeptide (TPR) repeat protein